jgi:hypothetical protein
VIGISLISQKTRGDVQQISIDQLRCQFAKEAPERRDVGIEMNQWKGAKDQLKEEERLNSRRTIRKFLASVIDAKGNQKLSMHRCPDRSKDITL